MRVNYTVETDDDFWTFQTEAEALEKAKSLVKDAESEYDEDGYPSWIHSLVVSKIIGRACEVEGGIYLEVEK